MGTKFRASNAFLIISGDMNQNYFANKLQMTVNLTTARLLLQCKVYCDWTLPNWVNLTAIIHLTGQVNSMHDTIAQRLKISIECDYRIACLQGTCTGGFLGYYQNLQ
jgi:hypothetical protein